MTPAHFDDQGAQFQQDRKVSKARIASACLGIAVAVAGVAVGMWL